jgi:hypothetical protein
VQPEGVGVQPVSSDTKMSDSASDFGEKPNEEDIDAKELN